MPSRKLAAFAGYTPEFEAFWAGCYRRIGKGDAFKAFLDYRPPLVHLLASMAAASIDVFDPRFKKATRRQDDDPMGGIPYPATWIRGRGWEDYDQAELEERGEWAGAIDELKARGIEV